MMTGPLPAQWKEINRMKMAEQLISAGRQQLRGYQIWNQHYKP
jgi:hypothetical protein